MENYKFKVSLGNLIRTCFKIKKKKLEGWSHTCAVEQFQVCVRPLGQTSGLPATKASKQNSWQGCCSCLPRMCELPGFSVNSCFDQPSLRRVVMSPCGFNLHCL